MPKRNVSTKRLSKPLRVYKRLYKRFSEITGVPLRELYPEREAKPKKSLLAAGYYDRITHTIGIKRFALWAIEEELRHALQNLADQRQRKNFERFLKKKPKKFREALRYFKDILRGLSKRRKWLEPVVTGPKINVFLKAFANLSLIEKLAYLPALVTSLRAPYTAGPIAATIVVRYLMQVSRSLYVRGLIKKHGEDGLLLLWVAPPKKLDALYIKEWEREMVKKGYLKEKGGLTKSGLRYWREHLQPQSIWEFLAKAKETRKLENL